MCSKKSHTHQFEYHWWMWDLNYPYKCHLVSEHRVNARKSWSSLLDGCMQLFGDCFSAWKFDECSEEIFCLELDTFDSFHTAYDVLYLFWLGRLKSCKNESPRVWIYLCKMMVQLVECDRINGWSMSQNSNSWLLIAWSRWGRGIHTSYFRK